MTRSARKKPQRSRPAPAGDRKRDATRRHLLEQALALFQKRGVDGTTMRDIARAAGLSLGAAYYHFGSKEELLFAFYEQNQRETEAQTLPSGTVRERLGALMHGKLEATRPYRGMLAAMIRHLVDPGDPLSAFSAQTRAVRERSIASFAAALEGTDLPPSAVPLVAHAAWLMQLAALLLFVNDDSRKQARTHGLIDDALDLVVPALPLLASPLGQGMIERIAGALARAGIELEPVGRVYSPAP